MEYGLIGEKLGHSFSKTVHSFLGSYDYELLEIAPEKLEDFMQKADFKAINVTIPYKTDVMPYLYEIDDIAKKIGAVNTVVNKNGRLYGYNTDFFGLKAVIEHANIGVAGKKVLILGSGGTSKTANAVAQSLGAESVYTVSRSEREDCITYSKALCEHNDAEIIINTTPCGMFPNVDSVPIDIDAFQSLCGVVDAVYNPLSSALVLGAKERGITAVGGLYMLVAQAFFAYEKFVDEKADTEKIEEIYKKILKEKQNLVLIGMPSSGKTTVGRKVAELLGKTFVDSDIEITKEANTTIPEIFKKFGEAHFRRLETQAIREISARQCLVIATGGGAVLNPENIKYLKQNGVVIFLNRSLENLITTDDRPLSSSREKLEKLYAERYNLYLNAADIVIDADNSPDENIKLVKEGFLNENSCH